MSVELDSGIKFVAPTKSRNSWSLNHLRLFTVSSCIMAMCAAGPPKAVAPSLENRDATCFKWGFFMKLALKQARC